MKQIQDKARKSVHRLRLGSRGSMASQDTGCDCATDQHSFGIASGQGAKHRVVLMLLSHGQGVECKFQVRLVRAIKAS